MTRTCISGDPFRASGVAGGGRLDRRAGGASGRRRRGAPGCRLALGALALAARLEALAAPALQVAPGADGQRVRPVERRAQRQVLRGDDAVDGAAKAALELVDAVHLLAGPQHVRDAAEVVVLRPARLG